MAARLTDIAITTRKIIRYGIYFVIFLIVARILFGFGGFLYKAVVPERLPPPTVGFSRLAAIPFPEQTQQLPDVEYTIETAAGGLPTFPEQMNVYFMPQPTSTLFSLQESTRKAAALGYISAPLEISPTIFRFSNPSVPSSFEINIVTGVFSTSYNLAADPSPLASRPPAPDAATSTAKGILKTADSLPEDLSGPIRHEFLKVEGQNLVSAISLSEADLVRVNLFRNPLGEEEYPSLTANPAEANVWVILSGASDRDEQVMASEYHYFPVDFEQVETYPIKTAEVALQDLLSGNGYIANLGLNQTGKVTIRRIYLAYYDPDRPTDFYQPIIVFEGDNNFFAYVPAVTGEFYGE